MLFKAEQEYAKLVEWLRKTAADRYTREKPLDLLATSMRDFDDVSPHLKDLEKGKPPSSNDPKQRITDLKKAKLAHPNKTALSDLGKAVLDKWRHFEVDNNSIHDELARHIILAHEVANYGDPDYQEIFEYWQNLRDEFGAEELIDNWDTLYTLNYLDYERSGIVPGNLFRDSQSSLDELDISLEEIVQTTTSQDQEALEGAEKFDRAVAGKIPRGRHRATFCLAMETRIKDPEDSMALITQFGVPKKPRKWEKIADESAIKIKEILSHYGEGQPQKAEKKVDVGIDLENVEELENTITDADLADSDLPIQEITLPENIDFKNAKVEIPEPKKETAPKKVKPTNKQKIDYEKKAVQSSHTGEKGEEFVVHYEKNRLKEHHELAEKVDWVSQKDDTLGYDVLSFDTDGEPLYIEVKSTRGDAYTDFFISQAEVQKAEALGDRYRIYRVFDLGKDPKFFEIKNPIEERLNLVPEIYKAKLN